MGLIKNIKNFIIKWDNTANQLRIIKNFRVCQNGKLCLLNSENFKDKMYTHSHSFWTFLYNRCATSDSKQNIIYNSELISNFVLNQMLRSDEYKNQPLLYIF